MTSAPESIVVTVAVTVLWREPTAPRAIDAPIVAPTPDHAGWLTAMDADGLARDDSRFGLLGRVDSQLVQGEPVEVLDGDDEWARVIAPWQASSCDPRGYPGWVRAAHLGAGPPTTLRPPEGPVAADDVLEAARAHVGVPYLWGGICATALDCSGLVHQACRALGISVPRDAGDQLAACTSVPLGTERPGDLYFFAERDKPIHHVGFATGDRAMLHAPGTGHEVIEEVMPASREATLVAAGRLPHVRVS